MDLASCPPNRRSPRLSAAHHPAHHPAHHTKTQEFLHAQHGYGVSRRLQRRKSCIFVKTVTRSRVVAPAMRTAEGRLASGMNRKLTALFSALEALLVLAIGVAIPLVPLTVLWAFQYGLQIDWIVFWRVAGDLWLLGSGVDIRMTLAPDIAASLGFAGAGDPFAVTIAPLGFALLTVLLGVRAGRRIGETPHRLLGVVTALATFALLALALTISVVVEAARPSIWQGALLPTLVFALGIIIGAELGRSSAHDHDLDTRIADRFSEFITGRLGVWRAHYRVIAAGALRAGVAAAGTVLAVSAVIVAALLLGNYAQVIALYESVHAQVLGGMALTVGQIALLPNVVIWASSWLVGPGFAIGTGSAISPLGTAIGPVPAIPMLGALPSAASLEYGFLGLLIPVLAGFVSALVLRRKLVESLGSNATRPVLVVTGLLIGIVGGAVLGLLAAASAGAAGPGRFIDVGPTPWLVFGWAALEIGLAAVIGLLVGRPRGIRATAPSR